MAAAYRVRPGIQTDDGQNFSFVRHLHDDLPSATYIAVSPVMAEPLSPLAGPEEKMIALRMAVLNNLPRDWKYTIPNADKRMGERPPGHFRKLAGAHFHNGGSGELPGLL